MKKIEIKEFRGPSIDDLNSQIEKHFDFGPTEILNTVYTDMGCLKSIVFVCSYFDV